MASNGTPETVFRPKELLLAAGLSSGKTLVAVAAAVGVPLRTARRIAAKPEFQLLVQSLGEGIVQEAAQTIVTILAGTAIKAARKLDGFLDVDLPGVHKSHLNAIRLALREFRAMSDHAELRRRIEAIEDALQQKGPKP